MNKLTFPKEKKNCETNIADTWNAWKIIQLENNEKETNECTEVLPRCQTLPHQPYNRHVSAYKKAPDDTETNLDL